MEEKEIDQMEGEGRPLRIVRQKAEDRCKYTALLKIKPDADNPKEFTLADWQAAWDAKDWQSKEINANIYDYLEMQWAAEKGQMTRVQQEEQHQIQLAKAATSQSASGGEEAD